MEDECARGKTHIKQLYMNGSPNGGEEKATDHQSKAAEIQQRKLLRNEIRDLERKLLEIDLKDEAVQEELKFQGQILSKVISQLPGASSFQRPPKNERNIEKEEALEAELEALV